MKVLIIDDEEDTRTIAAMSLRILSGFEVIEADSGTQGIEQAAKERPDAILCDMMMPEIDDGAATVKALRENPLTSGIPVILLTAMALSSELEQMKRLGAKGVITKPFDPTQLAAQVREILANE